MKKFVVLALLLSPLIASASSGAFERMLNTQAVKVVFQQLNLGNRTVGTFTAEEREQLMEILERVEARFLEKHARRPRDENPFRSERGLLSAAEARDVASWADKEAHRAGYKFADTDPVSDEWRKSLDDFVRGGATRQPTRQPVPAAPAGDTPPATSIRHKHVFHDGNEAHFDFGLDGHGTVDGVLKSGERVRIGQGRFEHIPTLGQSRKQFTLNGKISTTVGRLGEYQSDFDFVRIDGTRYVLTSKGKLFAIPADFDEAGPSAMFAVRNLRHGDRSFALVEVRYTDKTKAELFVVRDDGVGTRLGYDGAAGADFSVNDGILKVEGTFRRIDLASFDGEASFNVRRTVAVRNSKESKDAIDPIQSVDERYENLTASVRSGRETYPVTDAELLKKIRRTAAKRTLKCLAILGPPGSGKTQFVTDIAAMIARGEIPEIPRTWEVISVDAASLGAGNGMVGESEQRVLELLEAAKMRPTVYVMDEIHSLRGQGAHANNGNDVFQSLKKGMANGDMFIIGTSTKTEFYPAFSGDQALLERFTVLNFDEPAPAEVLSRYEGWISKGGYARAPREVLEQARALSSQYNAVGAQPRNGLRLLEEVYADLRISGRMLESPSVADVEEAASRLYQVDRALFDPAVRREKLLSLPGKLDERILGQTAAKKMLRDLAVQSYMGAAAQGKPRIQLLFAGDKGLGKTELAFAYAEAMGLPMARINMATYAYGKAPADLMKEVAAELKKNPFTVLFFDEIEKAAKPLQDALLTLTDRAELTIESAVDNMGNNMRTEVVKAHNATVLMATNAGKGRIARGRASDRELREALAADGLSEYLVDRLSVVAFAPMKEDEIRRVISMHLRKAVKEQSARQGVEFRVENESAYVDELLSILEGSANGRDAIRAIQDHVRQEIAEALLQGRACAGQACMLRIGTGQEHLEGP